MNLSLLTATAALGLFLTTTAVLAFAISDLYQVTN